MEYVKLGDICEVLNGYAFKSENYTDNGIRVIRITNVQKGFVEDNDPQFYPIETQSQIEKYLLRGGDLLISLTGNVGRVALLEEKFLPAALNQRVACLRLKNEKVLKSFLYHLLNSDYFENECIISAKGVAQKNMSTEWLKEFKIPLFPVDIQHEISNILDKVTDLINIRKEQLEKLDEIVKARFVELFGDLRINEKEWEIKTFSELAEFITDGEHSTPRRVEKGIYLLSARNVLNHSLQLNVVDYIDEDEYSRISKRIIPQKGDVLISCSGTVGRCCSVPENMKFQMVRSVAIVRFKNIINPIFAEYMITSDYLQEQINGSKTMSSQANLFQGKIAKLKGFVPPIELQESFVSFVEQTDKSKLEVQKSLEKLELLKKALMQKYFG